MTLNLTIPQNQHTDFTPRITVVGVGGGGTNAVNNMISMGLDGVEFLVANTDAQSLIHSRADRRVQLGPHLTQGLGAGAKPEIGRAAAEEATEELARHIEGMHMIFITAGMGGGTGTGAAPVIARMAQERGILTVGVVTKPFDFEGPKRRKSAEQGIEELQQVVDTLIIIPNQNLFRLANERTTFQEAFKMADNVLYMGVRGVTDLMINPGIVNLDFADIRTIMAEMGKAMMGTGESEGEDRARRAAEAVPAMRPAVVDTTPESMPEVAPMTEPPVMLAPQPAILPEAPQLRVPVAEPMEPEMPQAAPRSAGLRGLFGKVTGMGGMMKRNLSPQAEPQGFATEVSPPARVESAPAPRFEAARPAQQDEMSLEIPAFLRRQRS